MKINKITVSTILFCFLSVLIIIMQILPNVRYKVYYADIFTAVLPFLVIFCISDHAILNKLKLMTGCIVFMTAFRFVFNYFGNLGMAFNSSYELLLMCAPWFIFIVLAKRKNMFESYVVILTILIIVFVVGINTIKELSTNPGVARMLATGSTDDNKVNILRDSNIGGFGFSYAVGMFAPYVSFLICRSKGLKRLVFIVALAAIFIYAIYAQYTTLLLMIVISTLFVFIRNTKDSLFRIILIFSCFLLVINLSNVFKLIADHSSFETIASHFEDLYKGLQGEGLSSSRPELTLEALKVFMKNPFFGADLTVAANLTVVNTSHTTFFAILASGGIFGITLYYGVLFNMVHHIKNALPNFNDIKPVYITFFVLGFFNPIVTFEIFTVVFLVIPAIELLVNSKKEKLSNSGEVVNES